jgi:hypothetical protein
MYNFKKCVPSACKKHIMCGSEVMTADTLNRSPAFTPSPCRCCQVVVVLRVSQGHRVALLATDFPHPHLQQQQQALQGLNPALRRRCGPRWQQRRRPWRRG